MKWKIQSKASAAPLYKQRKNLRNWREKASNYGQEEKEIKMKARKKPVVFMEHH